jgi:hypothetical protein
MREAVVEAGCRARGGDMIAALILNILVKTRLKSDYYEPSNPPKRLSMCFFYFLL